MTESRQFFSELMNDYFAECEEHLSSVKKYLLELESSYNTDVVQGLYRSFHTMKGLSGMVGYKDAEHLAHHVESYLRELLKGRAQLSPEGLDVMIESAKLLDLLIGAHKTGGPQPDASDISARLDSLLSQVSSSEPMADAPSPAQPEIPGLSQEKISRLRELESRGFGKWLFEFTPSPELVERQINVNTVRSKLQEIGEIIHAAPKVSEDGRMTIDFIVASLEDLDSPGNWSDYGITVMPFQTAPAAAAPAGEKTQILPIRASNLVRVELSRLDELMRIMGDVAIARSHLSELIRNVEKKIPVGVYREIQETALTVGKNLRYLRDGIVRIRMVAVSEIFDRMRFAARDLARKQDKIIRVETLGDETEIDKYIVDRIADPAPNRK